MDDNMKQLIQELAGKFNDEVENSFRALLGIAKCPVYSDFKKMQVKLIENGYDIVECAFEFNPFKRFIYLTDIKNKFKTGFLVELDITSHEITRKRIRSKQEYERIIKSSQTKKS